MNVTARLGRVHLRVRDLESTARFYSNVLGLRIVARGTSILRLSSDGARHQLTLHADDQSWPAAPVWRGCRSVGFEVPSKAALAEACERLGGARATIVDTGDSWSIYTTDPDGNGVEVYCERHEDTARVPSSAAAARTVSLAELRGAAAAG